MTIKEIYDKFDKIGCLTFTTINEYNEPISRIAHLRAYDNDGIYFMTMFTKDFYKHLISNNKISVCGLNSNTTISHDSEGLPVFDTGYSIRMTGTTKLVSMEDIIKKENPLFDMCIKDYEKYKAMVVFCITKANGDIFDFDFEKINRENKIERTYFSYNDKKINYKGLFINQDKCIRCGICFKKCSFLAINTINKNYIINTHRCDECGDCYINCPVNAISYEKNS